MQQVQTSTLISFLNEARAYEQTRNLEAEAEVLNRFWSDFNLNPDTEGLPESLQAEVFRLCGNFLVHYGRSKAFSTFQERGKDLLTKAKRMFKDLNDIEQESAAVCQLALSYCYDGRAEEAEALLALAEADCLGEQNSMTLLRVQINRLIALGCLGKLDECLEIISNIEPRARSCEDNFLAIMFYSQCGFIFDLNDDPASASQSYRNAQAIAIRTNNRRAYAQVTNGLAFTLLHLGELDKALSAIRKAIAVALQLDDIGWLANFYDTKANIEIALGTPEKALETINRSLAFLETTTDPISHCESLWTKIETLMLLDRLPDALKVFSQLTNIASEQINEKEAARFAEQFARLISKPKKSFSLPEERKCEQVEAFSLSPEVEVFHAPIKDFLMFRVPRERASILGYDTEIIVCAERLSPEDRTNPMILTERETGIHRLGFYESELFSLEDDLMFHVLKTSPDPLSVPHCFDPSEVFYSGSVTAVAEACTLKNKFLYFEPL